MCEKCDKNVHTCNNCYWGQVDTKMNPDACSECERDKKTGTPSEWMELGNIYCRKCGRKLKKEK